MGLKNLGQSLQDAANSAGSAVKQSAQSTAEAIAKTPKQIADAMPSKQSLKSAMGNALVTGGKLLIDPKAVIGEAAVKMGENLLAKPESLNWFVIVVDEVGAAQAFAFNSKSDAQASLEETRRTHPRSYLCEVTDWPTAVK